MERRFFVALIMHRRIEGLGRRLCVCVLWRRIVSLPGG